MVRDILLKMTNKRPSREYKKSSSFKVATLFAILLAIAISTLAFSIYLFVQQSNPQNLSKLLIVLSAISIISLIGIAVIGYLISVFVVTRINRIADTAQEIVNTGDLTKRIEIDSRWDDLSFLGNVLNDMLHKIETLMHGVQHITDSVAHDLRTPLARLRNKLEHSEAHQNTQDTDKTELVHDVDNILKTFNSLLSLSSLESGRQAFKFEKFDLDKVVLDAVEMYQPLAEEKNQTLAVSASSMQYLGNRDLIFQVLANLMDNAIKFTPDNGSINVTLNQIENNRNLTIEDSGPGIPQNSIAKVFDRFYREGNQQHIAGSGLGLSLVNAVLKQHKATIKLENKHPGLKVVINL